MNVSSLRRLLWPRTLASRAAAAAVILVIILVSSYLAARYYTSHRLAAAWKLGEEFGLPTDLHELLGRYVSEDENAASPLDEAAVTADKRLTAARQRWKLGIDDEGLENPSFITDVFSIQDDASYEANLRTADARPGYYSPVQFDSNLVFTNMDYVSLRRKTALVERVIALKMAADGRRKQAVQRLLRWMRITRKWESREPFAKGVFFNLNARVPAIDALNTILRNGGPLQTNHHKEIDDALVEYETIRQLIPYCFQSERILHASDIRRFGTIVALPPLGLYGSLLADHRTARMLVNGHRIASLWDQPFDVAKAENRLISEELRQAADSPLHGQFNGGADSLAHSMFFARDVCSRHIARARCLRVVNAWAARGDFMAPLDTLGLPDPCLTDPFDGKRLRVVSKPDGPVVYAVGPDLKDDNGDVGSNPKDQGLGPATRAETK